MKNARLRSDLTALGLKKAQKKYAPQEFSPNGFDPCEAWIASCYG